MTFFLKCLLIFTMSLAMLTGCMKNQISREEAEESVLVHAGLTKEQVTVVKNEKEIENGKMIYEIEFYTEDFREYDYKIDASTGEILSLDEESMVD